LRHRIFIDALAPTVTVTGDEFHHSIRVVRARVGEEIELFDAAGNMAKGIIESIERDQAIVRVGDVIPSRESPLAIHLAMAIIQLEKFELVLQKATELGVASIIPLITDRIELRPERYANKAERWNRIVFEAVKQSGRSVIPKIESPTTFDEVIKRDGTKIVFDTETENRATAQPRNRVTAMIGPEGGWSERELELARAHNCAIERLGPRRLRAETAAIVATALIAARFGDL
jgi:16S rRNA (uracil1498-N3)-methyltransferase